MARNWQIPSQEIRKEHRLAVFLSGHGQTHETFRTLLCCTRKGQTEIAPERRIIKDVTLSMQSDENIAFRFDYGLGQYPGFRKHNGGFAIDGLFAVLTKEDVFTLQVADDTTEDGVLSLANRIEVLLGVKFGFNRFAFGSYKQPLRVTFDYTDDANKYRPYISLPYAKGMQVKGGAVLEPEKYQDYIRRVNRAKTTPLLREMNTLAKLLRVTARMEDGIEIKAHEVWRRSEPSKFEGVNYKDPTVQDVERLFSAACSSWEIDQLRRGKKNVQQLAERAYETFREWLYTKEGAYHWVPVDNPGLPPALKQAA